VPDYWLPRPRSLWIADEEASCKVDDNDDNNETHLTCILFNCTAWDQGDLWWYRSGRQLLPILGYELVAEDLFN
jgi:hypothetical protein